MLHSDENLALSGRKRILVEHGYFYTSIKSSELVFFDNTYFGYLSVLGK